MIKKYYYTPDDDFVYYGANKGAENHYEVSAPPTEEHQYDAESKEWYLPDYVIAQMARAERDNLLRETDYLMMPDYPNTNREAWEEYRQRLRDVTKQEGFPTEIEWPVKPS